MDSAWIVALECLSDDTWFDPDSHSFFYAFLCLSFHSHWTRIQKISSQERQIRSTKKNSTERTRWCVFITGTFGATMLVCLLTTTAQCSNVIGENMAEHERWWLIYFDGFLITFFTLSLCRNRILIGLRLTSRSRLAHQHTHTRRRRFLCRTNTRAQRWFSRNSKSCFSFIAFAISALFDWNLCTDCKEFTLSRENFESFRFSRSRVCATYMRNMSKCDRASVLRATVITITCRLSSLGARFTVYHARLSLRRQNCLLISTKPQKMARNFFTPRKFLELFFSLFTFSHFQVRERRNKYASRVTLNAVKLNSLRTLSKFLV